MRCSTPVAFVGLICATAGIFGLSAARGETAGFEGLPFSAGLNYENGEHLSPAGGFSSGGATFNNSYDTTYHSWSGWAYSKVVNTTDPSWTNQYASFAGGGSAGSANYGVAYNFSKGDATVDIPAGMAVQSARFTNTTYAALSMLNGDSFAKKFGGSTGNDPDYFLLTISGKDASGQNLASTVQLYLADYRFADNSKDYVLKDWQTADLSSLAAARKLEFTLQSTDVGTWGMNTPAYFAMDNLSFAAVPEPSAGVLIVSGLGLLVLVRRLRRS